MINYEVLQVGYVINSFGKKYPAELVYDYELTRKGLKVKNRERNGRYDDGWWFYELNAYVFVPTTNQITLIGV